MMANQFKHYPNRPKKLTADFVANEYQKLLDRLDSAESAENADEWIKLFADWNSLESYVGGEASRTGYAYAKNMADKKLEAADRYFSEQVGPVMAEPNFKLAKTFLNSKHQKAILKRYGQQLLPLYKTALLPMDPVNTKLRVKASKLINQYEKIIAGAKIKINGQTVNLYKARSFQFYANRKLRKTAYLASGNWFLKNHDRLANIFDKLVDLRTQMAKNVGLDNYVPFAYQMRGRQGYGEVEVEKFRRLVLKHLAPIYKQIAKDQAKQLNIKSLKPWDTSFNPKYDVPAGSVPVETQLDKVHKVFNNISPVLGKHFEHMRANSYIDLETRPNKRSGAFCTEFSDEGEVAILCNSTGDPDDVSTLTHEMGHAFQGLESQHIEAVDLQWGTMELAEVFSMSMEFLSLPQMHEFFDDKNAKRFAERKWIDSIFTICYVCVVDEFQHWVYKNPAATPTERDKAWIEVYSKYLGVVDFGGVKKYQKNRWYAQGHIFASPFYYIDYALAELCAMQLGMLSAKDYKATVKKYLKMARLGGTKSFLDAVAFGGLKSPFDESLIKEVAAHAKKVLS